MFGQLVVTAGPDQGRTYPLDEGKILVIGRGQATETRLRDPHVSRTHCQVEVDGGRLLLKCAGGAGGTQVNGERVTERELKPGDVIRIGDTELRFQFDDPAEQSTRVVPPASAPKPAGPKVVKHLTELTGTTISHFEVGPVLAKGRTGVIFQARDSRDDRTVAFKVLWPEYARNDDEMQRFVRAMKTVLPLRHPNLVSLFGAGKSGNYCWIAMEYVEGESLTELIRRLGVAGRVDWRHAFRVTMHLARALSFAHEQQIIHRNITPQNVIIRAADKNTMLGDLFLAKAMEGGLAAHLTRPGEVLGDVRFMAPERLEGMSHVDHRSDIYSLGALIYTLLAGQPPFEGTTLLDVIAKVRTKEPADPKKFQMAIPDGFNGIVQRMLAKRPENRYQETAKLLEDLERLSKFVGVAV